MKKSLFAGLEILEAGEPLSTDNGAFLGSDREVIDRLLRVGAKTHRHTGLNGLTSPAVAPSASVIASAGTIASDLAISLGYTLQDSDGGETLISPVAVVSTGPPLSAPQFVPSGEADYSAGELLVNTYFYALTFTDGEGGETAIGPSVSVERAPGFEHGRVLLSALTHEMKAIGAVGWRLYRAVGGGTFNLLATGDTTEDTFIDDGTHSLDCSTHPPAGELNTTNGISSLLVVLPSGVQAGTEFINFYASVGGDFSGGSLLEQFPVSSAGATAVFSALDLGAASPPVVNLSIGGAHQIDPDTELLDWHWKRPVATSAALGSGSRGDVRVATDSGAMYAVLAPSAAAGSASEWIRVASGTDPQPWGAVVTPGVKAIRANSFEKVSEGSEAGQLYSEQGFVRGCFVSWRVSQANKGLGLGLNTDPTTDAGFAGIDYWLNCSSTGTIIIRENGVEIGTFGSYVAGDRFAVTFDGRMVRYWQNGNLLRSVARPIGAALFLDSWWNQAGGRVTQVDFGPLSGTLSIASAASGNPGVVEDVSKFVFVGSAGASASVKDLGAGSVQVTVTAGAGGGGGAGSVAFFGSGSAVPGAETSPATKLELIGSGGVNVKESSPGGGVAKAILEGEAATRMDKGMGVMVLKTSEKGAARPQFKCVTWFCKEKPTNMAEFDIWIEEGP